MCSNKIAMVVKKRSSHISQCFDKKEKQKKNNNKEGEQGMSEAYDLPSFWLPLKFCLNTIVYVIIDVTAGFLFGRFSGPEGTQIFRKIEFLPISSVLNPKILEFLKDIVEFSTNFYEFWKLAKNQWIMCWRTLNGSKNFRKIEFQKNFA